MIYKKKINHVSKRPHQAYCVIGGGHIGCSHIMGRHHISGAMSALMDVDRRAIRPEGHCQCMCCWHVAAADSGGCAGN